MEMAKAAPNGKIVPELESATILVVEDELFIRLVISEYLRDCGYKVIETSSADEAVKVLKSEIKVDLVFTDVQLLGEMNGFALANWISANKPGVKVMLTSGYVRASELAGKLCEAGPFLVKPYDPQLVLLQIRRLLNAPK
jgi:CheY-like chemotaxis protein